MEVACERAVRASLQSFVKFMKDKQICVGSSSQTSQRLDSEILDLKEHRKYG